MLNFRIDLHIVTKNIKVRKKYAIANKIFRISYKFIIQNKFKILDILFKYFSQTENRSIFIKVFVIYLEYVFNIHE